MNYCFKVLLIILSLTAFLLSGALRGGLPAAAVPDLERLSPAELQALERELAAELLTLNLQMMGLQEDRARAEDRLAELAESRAVEEHNLAAARARLTEAQGRLGQWLRHLYEEGRLPMFALLLQAESTADFLWRLEFIGLLIEREGVLVNEVRTQSAAIEERLHQLAFLETETKTARSRISDRLIELQRVQNRRSALLAGIRGRSNELADRLSGLERQWQESLAPLSSLLGQLNIILARDVQPDRIYFQGRNMLIEVSSRTVNRALANAAEGTGAGLRIDIDRDGITATSLDPQGRPGFRVFGRLVPISGGEAVVFRAETVRIDDLEIDASALAFMAGDQGAFTMGDRFRFMTLTDITYEKDRMRFTLRRN
ncbi:MAG: hypothetical protein AB1441_03175 [Bacillota bacterium]